MKRFLALLMIVSMCAALIIPASASCDDCIEWEYNLYADNPDHCSIHCTGDSRDTCGSCGDAYTLELCNATHDYATKILTNPGTNCMDGGTEVWQCSCGDTTVILGSTYGKHDWNDGEIDSAAGKIYYTCSVCGETKADSYTPGHTHNFIKTVTKPTCTYQGFTTYRCSCGYSYVGDYVNQLQHNYVATVKAPTCSSPGYTAYVCSYCQDSYITDEKPITDHVWVNYGSPTGPKCSTEGCLVQLETDSDVAYQNPVPEDAGFAEITEIGGMAYKDGDTLVSAPVTEVECAGSKLSIPAEVQALDGYGLGINESVYNYIDWEKKQLVKRVGCVDMGTLDFMYTGGFFQSLSITDIKPSLYDGYKANLLCARFVTDTYNNVTGQINDNAISVIGKSGHNVRVACSAYTDAASFKAAMSGVMLVYELATPIITDISDLLPADNLIRVQAGGTVTMVNEYEYDVPSTITYYEDPVDCTDGHFYDSSEKCYLCGTAKAKRYQPVACSTCGETSMNSLPDLEHDFTTRLVPSTCSSPGYTAHTCEICGITYADNYTAQLAHNWGSRIEDAIAGKVYYTCTLCGETKVEDFDTDHDHVYTSTVVPATCTTRGYTLHQCSCGHSYYSDWVNVPGHKYAAVVISPTCEKPGFTIHTCTVCGQSFKDNFTNPEPHQWDVTTSKPTCITHGYTTQICSVCSYSEIISSEPPLGHTMINGVCTKCQYSSSCIHTYKEIVVEPTCHDQGYTLYSCTKCGDGTYGDYKAALSHVWLKSGSVQARCDKDGYTEYTCSLCGDPRYDTIPALGHKWTALGAQVNEDNTSVVTYGCDVCMIRKTETIQTAASQAQNWLLTSIRGFAGAIIDMYETVANGIEVGGVTAGEVLTGTLILCCFLLFGWFFTKMRK